MLARRLSTILPEMTVAEALETSRTRRVAGRTGGRTALVTTRTFRAPHQTMSDVGLIGGGPVPMLGKVSLAHHGVPLLEEFPKCRPERVTPQSSPAVKRTAHVVTTPYAVSD